MLLFAVVFGVNAVFAMDLDEIYREIEQEFDVSLRKNDSAKKEWQDYWAWYVLYG